MLRVHLSHRRRNAEAIRFATAALGSALSRKTAAAYPFTIGGNSGHGRKSNGKAGMWWGREMPSENRCALCRQRGVARTSSQASAQISGLSEDAVSGAIDTAVTALCTRYTCTQPL